MTWAPGLPVVTDTDRAEWRRWRKERKRQQQRERRAREPRIDYYPSPTALALVRGMTRPTVGHDYSSILNRIIEAWSAGATGINSGEVVGDRFARKVQS